MKITYCRQESFAIIPIIAIILKSTLIFDRAADGLEDSSGKYLLHERLLSETLVDNRFSLPRTIFLELFLSPYFIFIAADLIV